MIHPARGPASFARLNTYTSQPQALAPNKNCSGLTAQSREGDSAELLSSQDTHVDSQYEVQYCETTSVSAPVPGSVVITEQDPESK